MRVQLKLTFKNKREKHNLNHLSLHLCVHNGALRGTDL